MTNKPLQLKGYDGDKVRFELEQQHRAEMIELRHTLTNRIMELERQLDDSIEKRYKGTEEIDALREELAIERELVEQFAVSAGLQKFENEDLRRQLAEAQKIITTYSVDMCELHAITDEVFQLLYGANVGEPFSIDMVPVDVRTALNKQLEKFGEINEAMPNQRSVDDKIDAMRQHCETINAQLKAAQAENDRLRKLNTWKV